MKTIKNFILRIRNKIKKNRQQKKNRTFYNMYYSPESRMSTMVSKSFNDFFNS